MNYTIENDVYRKLYNDTAISEVKDFYYSARNYDLTNLNYTKKSNNYIKYYSWKKSTKLN